MAQVIQITEAEYADVSENSGGYCIECGEFASGVEPDARKYICDACKMPAVYGAEELLLMGLIEFVSE